MESNDTEHVLDIAHQRQVGELQRMRAQKRRRDLRQGGVLCTGNRHGTLQPFAAGDAKSVHDQKPVEAGCEMPEISPSVSRGRLFDHSTLSIWIGIFYSNSL
ncbi:hypothetical protein RHSP_54937 [Rhizobium freirei PRF 81]|uniref:Uncharacterized protein n=1 Tax=Rhizobium freirei PRF 81 TaxID=363754 RepID=N6UU68_9HYPH|nr:hypothetical protein RHSP_54937 [Rhizobium freirei PRF 81]